MIIRQAVQADAAQMCAIWNHYILNTTVAFLSIEKTLTDVEDVIAQGHCWVADDAGKIFGFARYFAFRNGEGYSYTKEHTILCDPSCHGRGVGRKLMDHLLVEARQAGVHSMIAVVSAENNEAVKFHDRCGFDHVVKMDQLGRKFDRWIGVVMMQKILNDD